MIHCYNVLSLQDGDGNYRMEEQRCQLLHVHTPATGDPFSTEFLRQSQVALETSSSLEGRRVPMTTATHTWGLDVLCRRRGDVHLALFSSDGTGRRSDHGHPWLCAVHGRRMDIRQTRRRLDHDHARRTWEPRSTLALHAEAGMRHSPVHAWHVFSLVNIAHVEFRCNNVSFHADRRYSDILSNLSHSYLVSTDVMAARPVMIFV